MDTAPLEQAMERAECALLRIERSIERGTMHRGADDALRGKVTSVLAELDTIIHQAGR